MSNRDDDVVYRFDNEGNLHALPRELFEAMEFVTRSPAEIATDAAWERFIP